MAYSIYLVEDEKNLNHLFTLYLQKEGFRVTSFNSGAEALRHVAENPDLWILDIMLPDIDGYELMKEIKAINEELPVIFISARSANIDRVVGFEMGCDDYLPKPFMPRELVLRSKRLLERYYGRKTANFKPAVLLCPPYIVDETKRTVQKEGQSITLTSKEFDLLLLFVKNAGRVFSREQILGTIWGNGYFGSDRVVDDLVRRVRKKLSDMKLETVYGYGYRLVKND